jgi:hypothetical protein
VPLGFPVQFGFHVYSSYSDFLGVVGDHLDHLPVIRPSHPYIIPAG